MQEVFVDKTKAVYLFSSNIRPLYEQDILNVVAAPAGLTYRFRYKAEYLADDLLDAWTNGDLKGRTCLILFSLQQPSEYHEAAFIPVRLGVIVRTWREEGPIYVVEFRAQGAASLAPAGTADPGSASVPALADRGGSSRWYKEHVVAYREYLTANGVKVPYRASASYGPDPLAEPGGPVMSGDEGQFFQTATEYLAGTSSFENAKFFRLVRLERRISGELKPLELTPGTGYQLASGMAYQLVLFHSQPRNVITRSRFAVDADPSVVVVGGRKGFEAASKYDVVTVPLVAAQLPGAGSREGNIEITPDVGVQGPELLIPVRVSIGRFKALTAMGAMVVALILLAAPSALSFPAQWVSAFLVVGVVLTTLVPFAMTGKVPWS
jgi:hypothetical protein